MTHEYSSIKRSRSSNSATRYNQTFNNCRQYRLKRLLIAVALFFSSVNATALCDGTAITLEKVQARQLNRGYSKARLTHWVSKGPQKPKGVFIVIHGLNLRPERMGDYTS